MSPPIDDLSDEELAAVGRPSRLRYLALFGVFALCAFITLRLLHPCARLASAICSFSRGPCPTMLPGLLALDPSGTRCAEGTAALRAAPGWMRAQVAVEIMLDFAPELQDRYDAARAAAGAPPAPPPPAGPPPAAP